MGFQPCHRDDPFTRRVRELYRANVVRTPRSGIDPLYVLAVRKRHVETRGKLASFIDGSSTVDLPAVIVQPAAGLNGLQSAGVDIKFGLELAATFLSVLGLPVPGAELNLSPWKAVSSIAFEVRDVKERSVDIGLLGGALTRRKVVRSPASAVFFADTGVHMFIITRVLTSPHFALRFSAKDGQSVTVSIDAVASVLGKAAGGLEWYQEDSDTVAFRGDSEATFAFAAVPCVLQPDDTFLFGLEADQLVLGAPTKQAMASHRPIVDGDGLLTLDRV